MKKNVIQIKNLWPKKINKWFLGLFLTLCILTLVGRLVVSALYDLGFDGEKFNLFWWNDKLNPDFKPPIEQEDFWKDLKNRRPFLIWNFTQFTWLTTIMMIIFLVFRFFLLSENNKFLGKLKWINSQSTLSIIAIYENVVMVIFWSQIFILGGEQISGEPLADWAFVITILVHAVLPILFTIYSIIFLLNDRKATLLRENIVVKSMLWPAIYSIYYLIICFIWDDPYPVTSFSRSPTFSFLKVFALMLLVYIVTALLVLIHNFLLIRFNRHYIYQKDGALLEHLQKKVKQIKKRAFKDYVRNNKDFKKEYKSIAKDINKEIKLNNEKEKR